MIPPQPKLPEYMTYREDRSPKYKGHTNIGHAKNAVNNVISRYTYHRDNTGKIMRDPVTNRVLYLPSHVNSPISVFKLDDGEWKLLWDFPKGFPEKDLPWLQ